MNDPEDICTTQILFLKILSQCACLLKKNVFPCRISFCKREVCPRRDTLTKTLRNLVSCRYLLGRLIQRLIPRSLGTYIVVVEQRVQIDLVKPYGSLERIYERSRGYVNIRPHRYSYIADERGSIVLVFILAPGPIVSLQHK